MYNEKEAENNISDMDLINNFSNLLHGCKERECDSCVLQCSCALIGFKIKRVVLIYKSARIKGSYE